MVLKQRLRDLWKDGARLCLVSGSTGDLAKVRGGKKSLSSMSWGVDQNVSWDFVRPRKSCFSCSVSSFVNVCGTVRSDPRIKKTKLLKPVQLFILDRINDC